MAKQRGLLLQIDIDAAIENLVFADILFVGADGRVEGDQDNVAAGTAQRRDQRVVAHAASAVHASSAGGEIGYLHGRKKGRPRWTALSTDIVCVLRGRVQSKSEPTTQVVAV